MNPHTLKILKIAAVAIAFRLAVYFLSFCIMILFGDYGEAFTLEDFLAGWQRWDATHYLRIAEHGYGGYTEEGKYLMLVFFPLYPGLMRLLSGLIPNLALSGMVLSTLAFAGGCCYLYRWMEEEAGQTAAGIAVTLLSIFPFAFFFGGIMTESLFLLTSMGTLYHLRKRQWWRSCIWLFLAVLTRLQGILLLLPALAEVWMAYRPLGLFKEKRWRETGKPLGFAAVLGAGAMAGVGVYLGINEAVSGNPFQFVIYQREHWHQGLGFLPHTLQYIGEYAVTDRFRSMGMAIWLPELVLFGVSLLLLGYGIKKLRRSASLYLIGYLTVVYSATWLLSAGRYLACGVPLFMIAGEWLTRHPRWKTAVYWLSASLFMMYLIAFYLWKQVM